MPSSTSRPPYQHTFRGDLRDVFLLVFVYFIGSLILWPLIILISVIFIPVTWVLRRLLLACSIPCTCGKCGLRCKCKIPATALESTWIKRSDEVMTYRQYRDRLRASQNPGPENDNLEAQAQSEPLMAHHKTDEGNTTTTTTLRKESSNDRQYSGYTYRDNVHSLVLVLEKSIDLINLVNRIDQRITALSTTETDGKYFPRFTQCLVRSVGGELYWVDDPSFSLSNHIHVEEGGLRGQTELESLLKRTAEQGLPADRPLWQLIIAPGYGTMKDTVLVWRFHGAMYDGVTIAKVIVYTLTNPKLITFKAFNQYYHHHNHVIRFLFTGPVRFLYLLLSRDRARHRANEATQNSNVISSSPAAHFSWTERTLNLSLLLKNKMLLSMTFNDLILSLFTGAAHEDSPDPVSNITSDKLNILGQAESVLIPFDMWTGLRHRKTLPQGNRMVIVPCQTSRIQEVIPRLWHTEHHLTEVKRAGDTRTQMYMCGWLSCLPFSQNLCTYVHRRLQGDSNVLLTSFPGPNTLDNIDGASIRDIMYFACPPQGVEYSFNFISYSGTIKLMTQSSVDLTAHRVDYIVRQMSTQLNVVNKMIFHRYFPDGLDQSLSPYAQPQASRLYSEFMKRLKEVDGLSSDAERYAQPSPVSVSSSPHTHPSPDVVSRQRQLIHDEVDSTKAVTKCSRSRTPSPKFGMERVSDLSAPSVKTSRDRKDSPLITTDPKLGLNTASITWTSENENTASIDTSKYPLCMEGKKSPTRKPDRNVECQTQMSSAVPVVKDFVTPSGGNLVSDFASDALSGRTNKGEHIVEINHKPYSESRDENIHNGEQHGTTAENDNHIQPANEQRNSQQQQLHQEQQSSQDQQQEQQNSQQQQEEQHNNHSSGQEANKSNNALIVQATCCKQVHSTSNGSDIISFDASNGLEDSHMKNGSNDQIVKLEQIDSKVVDDELNIEEKPPPAPAGDGSDITMSELPTAAGHGNVITNSSPIEEGPT